jgi:hypothetical protein
MKLEAPYLERHSRQARKFRRPARPMDALDASMQRRQRATGALDRPDPVELTHAH